jgi:RHS repeat-associated protein
VWNETVGTQEWDLDMLGNWKQVRTELDGLSGFEGSYENEDRQHNLANQLVEQQEIASPSVPARPLAYDDAGNLVGIQIHQSPHVTLRYTYDAWNRLVKVQNEIDTGSGLSYSDVAEYEYNAMHWRTVKREGGEERRFYYSASWQLVQEDIDEDYVGSPGVDRYAQQFWGIRYIDDAAARRRVDGQSESLYFHITDGQFATVAVLDESAALQERVSYSAYGRATHFFPHEVHEDPEGLDVAVEAEAHVGTAYYNPDWDFNRDGIIDDGDWVIYSNWLYSKAPLAGGQLSDPFGPDNPIGYSGYVFNPETGLLLARHRYYNPSLGRWMSEDWLGDVDGSNRYQFAVGNPLAHADPTGLFIIRAIRNGIRKAGEALSDVLSGGQGASTAELQRLRDKNCADLKRNFETGKICEAEFEKWWKAFDCGEYIGGSILMGAAQGFLEGAHDGAVVTFYHALDTISMGLLSELLPFDQDWLIDHDTPFLEVSAWMGTIAGYAIQAAVLRGPGGPDTATRFRLLLDNSLVSSRGLPALGSYNPLTGMITLNRNVIRNSAAIHNRSTRTELYRTAYHEALHKGLDNALVRGISRLTGYNYQNSVVWRSLEEAMANGYGMLRAYLRERRR